MHINQHKNRNKGLIIIHMKDKNRHKMKSNNTYKRKDKGNEIVNVHKSKNKQ